MRVLGATLPTGSTWPNGILKIHESELILHDALFRKEIIFPKREIERIEIRKIFPIIGYGIRIHANDKNQTSDFWYVGWHFGKFIDALKDCGYKVG